MVELRSSLEKARVIKRGDYQYFIHPITDGIPFLIPEMLTDVVEMIVGIMPSDYNKIVCVEAMGIHLGTALSLRTKKPLTIIRKKKYGLEGEIEVMQRTGYSYAPLYINGIEKGEKIVLIDDVISTGGTITSVVNGLREAGVNVVDVITVVEKGDKKVSVEKKLDIKIKSLIRVEVENGCVRVI